MMSRNKMTTETTYPFIRNIIEPVTLRKRFEAMRQFHPRIETTETRPVIDNLADLPEDLTPGPTYRILVEPFGMNHTEIVDVFQETELIEAHRSGSTVSLSEAFRHNVTRLMDMDPVVQRQRLRQYAKPISRFRPTTMISLIKIYRPKYILDFCSGWGDRLLGALAYDDRIKFYAGVDPNRRLSKGYNEMIEFFTEHRHKYQMVEGCAEEVDYPVPPSKTGKYDLVITSPPYFDLEIYSDAPTQSTARYNDVATWYDRFLLPATMKAVDLLDEGGHLVISLNDGPDNGDGKQYTEKFVREVSRDRRLVYEGILYTIPSVPFEKAVTATRDGVVTGCQPLWIWRKT